MEIYQNLSGYSIADVHLEMPLFQFVNYGLALRRHQVQPRAPLMNIFITNIRFFQLLIELSNISFAVGYGFRDIEPFLLKAREVAGELGDRRSHARLGLHIGRL